MSISEQLRNRPGLFEERKDPETGTKFKVQRGKGGKIQMKAEGGDATGSGEFMAGRRFDGRSLAFEAQAQGAMKSKLPTISIMEVFSPKPVKPGRKKGDKGKKGKE